jgi:hypothetical protein
VQFPLALCNKFDLLRAVAAAPLKEEKNSPAADVYTATIHLYLSCLRHTRT